MMQKIKRGAAVVLIAAGLIMGAAAPASATQHTTDNRTNDDHVTDS